VSKIYPSLDQRTRSARVEIRVENPTRRLMPGMYARVQLVLAERKNVLAVPVSSVVLSDEAMQAFVVDLRVAKAVKVRLGIRSGSEVEVLSGLADGDKLVVEGQSNLKDGDQVDVVPSEGGR
ncbi:MAG: efflux RND transporter periplasmic adaptor subunit, partial [Candidatus Eisenbacteria bacterium]|nr:efflux RND transporter periplasmic adaptor subunit [Candidatus Eisenbacteria bacterium]